MNQPDEPQKLELTPENVLRVMREHFANVTPEEFAAGVQRAVAQSRADAAPLYHAHATADQVRDLASRWEELERGREERLRERRWASWRLQVQQADEHARHYWDERVLYDVRRAVESGTRSVEFIFPVPPEGSDRDFDPHDLRRLAALAEVDALRRLAGERGFDATTSWTDPTPHAIGSGVSPSRLRLVIRW